MDELTKIKHIKQKSKAESTIVFVTNQKRCVNLIEIGRKIALTAKTPLIVINVSSTELSAGGATSLDYLFEQSKAKNAEMKIIYSDSPIDDIKKSIIDLNGKHIVTGHPENENSVVFKIQQAFPEKIFYAVIPEAEEYIAKTGKIQMINK